MQNYAKKYDKVTEFVKTPTGQTILSHEAIAQRDERLLEWLKDLGNMAKELTDNFFFDENIEETAKAFFLFIAQHNGCEAIAARVIKLLYTAKKIQSHIVNANDDYQRFDDFDERRRFIFREAIEDQKRLAKALSLANDLRIREAMAQPTQPQQGIAKVWNDYNDKVKDAFKFNALRSLFYIFEKDCIDLIEQDTRLKVFAQQMRAAL